MKYRKYFPALLALCALWLLVGLPPAIRLGCRWGLAFRAAAPPPLADFYFLLMIFPPFLLLFFPGFLVLTGQLWANLRFWGREARPVRVAELRRRTLTNRYGTREIISAVVRPLEAAPGFPEELSVELSPIPDAPALWGGEPPITPRDLHPEEVVTLCRPPRGKYALTRRSRKHLFLWCLKNLLIFAFFIFAFLYAGLTRYGSAWLYQV